MVVRFVKIEMLLTCFEILLRLLNNVRSIHEDKLGMT